MSCRTRLFLSDLLLPPSPNFYKWKLHSEGILSAYPLSFTLHILSISKLCQLLVGNISIQLDLRAAALLDPKALCLSLGLLARSSMLFPLSPSTLFLHSSQSEPFIEVKLRHSSLQVSKWFPISLR